MLIRRAPDIPSSEITGETLYYGRRDFMAKALAAAAGAGAGGALLHACTPGRADASVPPPPPGAKLAGVVKGPYGTDEPRTPFKDVASYNNFYELSTDKDGPAELAGTLRPRPWSVAVSGEVAAPKTWDLDSLVRGLTLEERVYRMRCVEGWSMVIPWVGFPLAKLIERLAPTSRAKYVRFETLYDPVQLPNQKSGILDWPYVEGLRMDEAASPLAILAVGLYGETLPNQNGAPLRLVVPWKYGFKGIKSIVKIHFQETEPVNTWKAMAPGEYGFFANVNPDVDHPRWSQATERRLGEFGKRKTLPFNGYGEHVASFYAGMDPRKLY